MDRDLWTLVLPTIKHAAARVGWNGGRRKPVYANWLIVAMYVWSVGHDRPLSWACARGSYGRLFRPRVLPSISQFSRRVRSEDCQRILQRVHDALARRGAVPMRVGCVDAKALPVSPVSKDPDATRGKISGAFARGYKLHAVIDERRRIVVWSLMGLNADEKTVAQVGLLPRLGPLPPDALLLGDSNYDAAPLHRLATPRGLCLLHPLRGQDRAGGVFRARKLRQMPPSRRALVTLWEKHAALTRFVMKWRWEIERVFGRLTCTAGGLSGLPAWVRRLSRVRRWVGVKIVLYNARLTAREARQLNPLA